MRQKIKFGVIYRLLMFVLAVIAAIFALTLTANAKAVGDYEIAFKEGGDTASKNGITAAASMGDVIKIDNFGGTFVEVTVTFAGGAETAGMLDVQLRHGYVSKDFSEFITYEDEITLKKGELPENKTVLVFMPHDKNTVDDLEMIMSFKAEGQGAEKYRLTPPSPYNINGQTFNIVFGSELIEKDFGTRINLYITGAPVQSGKYEVTLSSKTMGFSYSSAAAGLPISTDNYMVWLNDYQQDFRMPEKNVDDFKVSVRFIPDVSSGGQIYEGGTSGLSSGGLGGSSSGGSSGGGGSYSGSGGGALLSRNVPEPKPLSAANAVKAVNKAMKSVKDPQQGITVTFKNITGISLETAKEMLKTAGNAPIKIKADSLLNNGVVDVRLTVDLNNVTKDLNLSASTTSNGALKGKRVFGKAYGNKILAVDFKQEGSFGADITAAVNLSGSMVNDKLKFYSYNNKANSFNKLEIPGYKVDKKGYVHFTVNKGGIVIISSGELAGR